MSPLELSPAEWWADRSMPVLDLSVGELLRATAARAPQAVAAPDDDPLNRATTLGRPLAQTELEIIDVTSGATVAAAVAGELCTRGYHVMVGYFNDPEAIDPDGWLHTGDLAAMDARGYCRSGVR